MPNENEIDPNASAQRVQAWCDKVVRKESDATIMVSDVWVVLQDRNFRKNQMLQSLKLLVKLRCLSISLDPEWLQGMRAMANE